MRVLRCPRGRWNVSRPGSLGGDEAQVLRCGQREGLSMWGFPRLMEWALHAVPRGTRGLCGEML